MQFWCRMQINLHDKEYVAAVFKPSTTEDWKAVRNASIVS